MNTYSITDIGKEREKNQDRFSNYFHSAFSLLIVADGMGGYQGGEIAAQLAVSTIRDFIIRNKQREDYESLLVDAIAEANIAVVAESKTDDDLKSMGTTVVCVLVIGDRAIVAHVGDSRCYLWREEGLRQITRDHSLVADLVREGVLSPEDAKVHPERSAVTRAIGAFSSVEAEIDLVDLVGGDKLLICTDGLTNMLEDDQIASSIHSGGDCKTECENLVALANEAGGHDNITVTLYEFEG